MAHDTQSTRTLVNRKGQQVVTPYTDAEAFKLVEQRVLDGSLTGFAADLLAKGKRYGLSDEQFWWVHRLAVPQEAEELDLYEIYRAFQRGHQNGVSARNQKIDVKLESGAVLRLSMAGPRSKYAGCVMVTDDGVYPDNKYYGKIDSNGFLRSFSLTPELIDKLLDINEYVEGYLPW